MEHILLIVAILVCVALAGACLHCATQINRTLRDVPDEEFSLDRDQFLQLFAEAIQQEVEACSQEEIDATPEPYRMCADKLADAALAYIP